jgi:hypothetical protein
MQARLFAIGISVLLGACAAPQIHSYNDALVEFYASKAIAEEKKDWARYETAAASLENLAREAEQAADSAPKVANKISLYRVGATAAWQSERRDDVLRIASKGSELCAAEGNAGLAPRDCAMLGVIPVLAAIDENTRNYERLNIEVSATEQSGRETEYGASTVELFDAAEKGVRALLDEKEKAKTGVSDGYSRVLDQNIEIAAGALNETYQLLRKAHNVDAADNGRDPAEANANCRVIALKKMLDTEGLAPAAGRLTPEAENAACP